MSLTLNEWLIDKKLWDEIQAVKHFPFLEGNLSMVMESSLKALFGQRIMFAPMVQLSAREVAFQLVIMHEQKWLAMTTAASELNLAGDYVIRKKGSSDKNSTKETDALNEHQTVAYNEEALSTESGDKTGSKESGLNKEVSEDEEEKISYSSYFKNLQNADRLDIMNSILLDAARLLTINVY